MCMALSVEYPYAELIELFTEKIENPTNSSDYEIL